MSSFYKHLNHLKNALQTPEFSRISLKFDTFHQKILIRFIDEEKHYRLIIDDDYTKISVSLEDKGIKKISLQNVIRITTLVAKQKKFNSVRQTILKHKRKKLSKAEIENILETFMIKGFGAEDTPYNRLFSRTILLSMVKRIFVPGCQVDWLFILYGAQGIGKSRGLQALCSPFLDTYVQTSLMTKDNDMYRMSIGKLIIEICELYGLATKELEYIKALITKDVYEWIEKYQIHAKKHKLTNILVGTTNEREHLTDATGNRRFLFCDVGITHPVDIEWIINNILSVLKATLIYLRITSWQLPYQEINALAKQNHFQYEATSTIQEAIYQYLTNNPHKKQLTILELLSILTTQKIPLYNSDQKNRNEIGKALKKFGWENIRKKEKGTTKSYWQKIS